MLSDTDVAFNPSDQIDSQRDDFESDAGSDDENDDNFSDTGDFIVKNSN